MQEWPKRKERWQKYCLGIWGRLKPGFTSAQPSPLILPDTILATCSGRVGVIVLVSIRYDGIQMRACIALDKRGYQVNIFLVCP